MVVRSRELRSLDVDLGAVYLGVGMGSHGEQGKQLRQTRRLDLWLWEFPSLISRAPRAGRRGGRGVIG